MRRRPPPLRVTLCPFLSVLLCTLGSLILLLIVLDQKARQERDVEIALEQALHAEERAKVEAEIIARRTGEVHRSELLQNDLAEKQETVAEVENAARARR